jgi:hypothetical protein
MTGENDADEKVVEDLPDGLYDPNNKDHVNARKAASGRRLKLKSELLKNLMSFPGGRDFIWDILSMCGVHKISYHDIPTRMAFFEGQRNVGLAIEAQVVGACPKEFAIMHQEHQDG